MIVSGKINHPKTQKMAIRVNSLDWHQDCLSVTVLVASSFGPKAMRKLLRRSGYKTDGIEHNNELLLASMHEACHHDPEIRDAVAKELGLKYKSTVAKCKGLGVDEIERQATEGPWLIPYMWACFQRDDPQAHRLGRQLAHLAIYNGMRQLKLDRTQPEPTARLDRLINQNASLRGQLEDERNKRAQLQARLHKMSRAPEDVVKHTQAAIVSFQKETEPLKRELREEKEKNKDLSKEIAVWRSLAIAGSREPMPKTQKTKPEYKRCSFQEQIDGFQDNNCDACENAKCILRGRRVAVVGGLKRLEKGYCEVVQKLGGECLFHSGEMRSGSQGLRQLVNKSDMVVCITSVNSHGAMNAVKKQCKRCRKRFCPLNGAGVGALESLLIEVAS